MTPLDFKTVVPAAQAGDKTARDALMTAFYAWSVTQAREVVHEAEAAKNVAVDFWTWLFAEGGVLEYDPEKGAFYPWMAAQIRHIALAAAKKGRPKINYHAEPPAYEEQNADFTARIGALRDLEEIALTLPSAPHKDVYWRLIEGATPREIEEETGLSAPRVRKLVRDVRAAITERLEN